jgi:nanoRNase/pAp phosphatase (c-di-AMP/oligoRNAs hydrolase)
MNKSYPFEELRQLIDQNQSVTIFLPDRPQFDEVAAALALKLALEKKGKQTAVLASTSMTVEFSQLVGIDTIGQKNETGQNLVIILNYPLEQIEKVSYNDNGGKLNLVIQPKAGAPRVEKDQTEFTYEGENKD